MVGDGFPAPSVVGVYECSRRLRHLVAAAEDGGPPLLITRHHHPVALLVSVELGLKHSAAARPPTQVGMTRLMGKLSEVLQTVEQERCTVTITRHRRPRAMLIPPQGPVMDEYRRAAQRQLDQLLQDLQQAPGPTLDEVLEQLRAEQQAPPG